MKNKLNKYVPLLNDENKLSNEEKDNIAQKIADVFYEYFDLGKNEVTDKDENLAFGINDFENNQILNLAEDKLSEMTGANYYYEQKKDGELWTKGLYREK